MKKKRMIFTAVSLLLVLVIAAGGLLAKYSVRELQTIVLNINNTYKVKLVTNVGVTSPGLGGVVLDGRFQTTVTAHESYEGKFKYVNPPVLPTEVNVVRDGYKFVGWYAASDFSGTVVTQAGIPTDDDTVTYYAKWEKMNTDDIPEEPDKPVTADQFRIHINHTPTKDDTLGWNVQIWNAKENTALMRVTFKAGDTVYMTGLIAPGQKLEYVPASALSGTNVTAVIQAYEKTDNNWTPIDNVNVEVPMVLGD